MDSYTLDNPDDMAMDIAKEFRQRRIERNITREEIAEKSKVALANVIRFEQKGLISLRNLISLAVALEYTAEIKNIFSQPKYSTMEELTQIKKNSGKKRAYKR
ncbi:MAG: helix-turn-helix transcriptional regulator [Bacteroidia bacterium]|nr:helix-turn-helix transcriptional regulator [Bacteroidia bacterium]